MKFKVKEIKDEGGKVIAVIEGEGMKDKHKKALVELFDGLNSILEDRKVDPFETLELVVILRKLLKK